MMHGINNEYLYTAKKIIAKWSDGTNTVELRGTGFFIRKEDTIYLITNRHVVDPEYNDKKYKGYNVIDFSIESYQAVDDRGLPCSLNTVSLANWNAFEFHSNEYNDVACLKRPQSHTKLTIDTYIDYNMIATKEWNDEKLSVCDTVAYPGFPEWYDRQNSTPIFRMGTISSDPRLNYSYIQGAPVADRIAYEGFSTGGASGSPVFSVQRGFPTGGGISAPKDFYREVRLIGINAGHFSDQEGHSGISYLYKSSTILDLIDNMQK